MKKEVIELKEEKAIAKVYNKKQKKWYFLIEETSSLPFSGYLKNGDDLYLSCSLTAAPWLWGDMEDMQGNKIEYKLTKKELIKRLNELKDCKDSQYRHIEADRLLIQFIEDKEIKEAYEAISKWYGEKL